MKQFFIFGVLAACLVSEYGLAASLIQNTSGQFTFEYKLVADTKTMNVDYAAAQSLNKKSRIVIVLHGDGRESARYRKAWQPYAEKYNLLVLCPEFTDEEFPGPEKYNYGNVYDFQANRYTSPDEWTFAIIEQLFDFTRQDPRLDAQTYCLFGHSSGAQLVHRMVLFMPEARFSLAIANGAGRYTEPNFADKFPDGLQYTPVNEKKLQKAFLKEMILLVGQNDYVSKTMPKTPEAFNTYDRLWRAKAFMKCAKTEASKNQWTLKWKLQIVPGADHNYDSEYAAIAGRLAAASKRSLTADPNTP